jgi:hypothetical protein
MLALELLLFLGGLFVSIAVVLSAVRTVAVPRSEQVWLAKALFAASGWAFGLLVKAARSEEAKEAFRARYAPMTMLMMPFAWAMGVIGGFSAMFWASGVRPYRDAVVLSGSSFTTLGFRSTEDFVELAMAIAEALLGLGLVALLISFMPSLYSAFSRREALVARLEVRAGKPPSSEELILRAHRIGWLGSLADTWAHWENWFIEVEEAHTTYPALNFFRSPVPWRSWITAAGAVLDASALLQSSVSTPNAPEASLCIRAGYVALARIAEVLDLEYDVDPAPGDPISVPRAEFDDMWDRLAAEGVPLVSDREQAWRDFAGWRVNYDRALRSICARVDAPPGRWSST